MGSRLDNKSKLVRKRIEGHTFEDEGGEEYEGSTFGGFNQYFRRKKIKLQNLDAQLRAQSEDKPKIFKGVVCHVNGYTQPSLKDLHNMVVQYGGGFVQYLDGKTMVTHIIASNLTPKKKEEFKRYRIVKPAWIVDSVNAGKLLPWDAYRVIDEGVGQKVLGFENGNVITQANRKTQGYKEQTDTSWYTTQLKAKELQTAGSSTRKQPSFTQTTTPQEEIEDDEYPLPEITSSIERAMGEVDYFDDDEVPESIEPPVDAAETGVKLETPPPTSPPPVPAAHASTDYPVTDVEPRKPTPEQTSPLRPRQGSQEPDYSMAIVRDSDALRSISPSRLAQMTAEEHNALLLSDPRIRKSTVVHPDFLEQYYRESRLHHLSTWKADLKAQLQALAAEKTTSQKQQLRVKKLPGQRRYIMHVDFDSFFAAVSLKRYPQYIDKPAVVAHGGGSGSEIASCNYPAREFGVKNGMWMRRAQELCPEIKILPYDFPGYEEASRKFYDAIMATGGVVQSVSIDEALVDISGICFAQSGTDGVKRDEGGVFREQAKADAIAQSMRDEVLDKTGCAVSVGIGGNILLAKVALRKAKPAGQYQLRPEQVLEFIGKLEVQNLPGVAWSIGGKLEEIGAKLVKDIRELTKEKLMNTLGPKTGEKLYEYARGIDRAEVGDQVVRKSVSAEVNWGVRFENQEQVDEFMHGLCGELHKRLLKERVKGKQLTMKVMRRAGDAPRDPPKHLGHGKCDTVNKSVQLGVATSEQGVILKEILAMMKSFGISPGELRGIGVQMQKLEPLKGEVGAEGGVDAGSQRRLPFKSGQGSKLPPAAEKDVLKGPGGEKAAEDLIQDDIKTPVKAQRFVDAINKPSVPIRPANPSTPSKRLLNTLGTQFVLPTQVDPSVLAELPEDIRSKLAKLVKPTTAPPPPAKAEIGQVSRPQSRAQSPATLLALPNESQLDPSILDALPEDVRAEILGFYSNKSPGNRKRGEQALLPQSPRKLRSVPIAKQPVKRKRGGGLFAGRPRSNLRSTDHSTLTQANFVARPVSRHLQHDEGGGATTATDTEAEPVARVEAAVDPEFLAALPEDVRREVLAQQRNARLQRAGGIDLSLHQRPRAQQRGKKKAGDDEAVPERVLVLPPRPARPTFTSRKLTELPDLREAVKAWYMEFENEGPYEEDVVALEKYLRDVVVEERDSGKAAAVVKWLSWLMDEGVEVGESARIAWKNGLDRLENALQDAISGRVARG
ncbi:deoxycytidyl transferase [Friedmanniomyces endolithicus]|uniref:DNA repair protein REV1 n=1 Tax=Friedmanniomyces endolithicus TaxID=329885 RepID=A0A4U0VDM0_9PEZI|nr:deoxycytidyl transferase [Friedmanniomyces endolithicus]KAK0345402.1 deoxycytidyl transferase [Friedmanniomyces endolithicus]KAK0793003.1 deoxycytidyl transferase [Friedmanniomyces endolithicus]KAK0802163.1 deoxycytidyl transferase [Friedmanniomyces endolithicus]KAK0851835.1 deoxycytidyl transferase [Friedmanniomyces endolithicus]